MADTQKVKEKRKDRPENLRASAKKMTKLLFEHKASVIFVLIISIVATVLNNIGPVYLGDIIDNITELIKVKLTGEPLDFTRIKQIILTILVIYLSSSFMTFLQHYVMAGINRNLIFSMRDRLNRKLSTLPLSYFDSRARGDILSRVTNDIDNIQNTFQNNLVQILTSVVSVIGVFVIMMIISPLMTLISVVALPAGLICAYFILNVSRKYFRLNWSTLGTLNGHIEEMYTGHRIVKVFGYTDEAVNIFRKTNGELCEIERKAQFFSGILNPIIAFISNIGYVLICIFGGIFVLQGKISLGDMTVFFVYSKLFMQPIVDLSNITNSLQSSLASAERVFEILEEKDEPADVDGGEELQGNLPVEFRNVDFSYTEGKEFITDLNITVNPGQLVALVGPTGAGKTTVVNLLMRFYDVTGGEILLGGKDIRNMPRETLRRHFGMVLQDTWLFAGTVADNIAYGKDGASREDIISAAKTAMADEFISALPEGYDTVLDEGGGNLSQGQQQLLTIARAILSDPEIIILDEATSSVDTRTELLIQEGMNRLMANRTNFVIAHRLSTIRNADVILVMNDGAIVESGTHDSLMAKNGFYKEIYEAQFSGATL